MVRGVIVGQGGDIVRHYEDPGVQATLLWPLIDEVRQISHLAAAVEGVCGTAG